MFDSTSPQYRPRLGVLDSNRVLLPFPPKRESLLGGGASRIVIARANQRTSGGGECEGTNGADEIEVVGNTSGGDEGRMSRTGMGEAVGRKSGGGRGNEKRWDQSGVVGKTSGGGREDEGGMSGGDESGVVGRTRGWGRENEVIGRTSGEARGDESEGAGIVGTGIGEVSGGANDAGKRLGGVNGAGRRLGGVLRVVAAREDEDDGETFGDENASIKGREQARKKLGGVLRVAAAVANSEKNSVGASPILTLKAKPRVLYKDYEGLKDVSQGGISRINRSVSASPETAAIAFKPVAAMKIQREISPPKQNMVFAMFQKDEILRKAVESDRETAETVRRSLRALKLGKPKSKSFANKSTSESGAGTPESTPKASNNRLSNYEIHDFDQTKKVDQRRSDGYRDTMWSPPQHAHKVTAAAATTPTFSPYAAATKSMLSTLAAAAAEKAMTTFGSHYEDYSCLCVVGTGSFGKVTLAKTKDETERVVAIKVLDRKKLLERGNLRRAHSEIRCLRACEACPFIVSLLNAFETSSTLYIVQSFCAGGELFSLLSRMGHISSKATQFYAAQCALALDHLHSKRYAYRDLKTENIMFDSRGYVRLVDFGLVKEGVAYCDRGGKSFVGTHEYVAPEMISRKGHGFAVDYWALGVVIYELIVGLPPWYTKKVPEMLRRICHDELVFNGTTDESPVIVPTEAKETIRQFLNKNPLKRLGSLGGFTSIKQSAFFRDMDWNALANQTLTPPFVPDLVNDVDVKYFSQEFLDLPLQQFN